MFEFFGMSYPMHESLEREELQPSWATQLDWMGTQPHSREHLEREVNCARSQKKYQMIEGEMMDYVQGVQFTDRP